jgi:hypothetical protein
MKKRVMKAGDSSPLAAVLRASADEYATHLSGECAACPQAAGLIEKIPHLRAHNPETGRGAEDEGVSLYEIVEINDRYVGEGLPLLLGAAPYQDFLGDELWYLEQLYLHTWNGARA